MVDIDKALVHLKDAIAELTSKKKAPKKASPKKASPKKKKKDTKKDTKKETKKKKKPKIFKYKDTPQNRKLGRVGKKKES